MFDFELGEELALLQRTARDFSNAQLRPKLRSAEAARGVAAEVQAAYAEIGLGALELPAAYDGAGLGPLARVLVNEQLGSGDAGAALALDRLGPALYPLLELGGEGAASLLRSDVARAALVVAGDAELAFSGERVSGEIAWIPSARVDALIVLDTAGAILVCDGMETQEVKGAGLRAAGGCALSLHAAPIAARWRDEAAAQRALARARLYVASLLVGVLREAAEYSRRYALERVAFGKPIAHHQALAFLITDMHSAVEGAHLLLLDAACRAERGQPYTGEAASAFVEAVEASHWVGPAAVQILGGHGFMQDHPVEKHMREARALGLWLGGVDAAREHAGALVCAGEAPVELSPLSAWERA